MNSKTVFASKTLLVNLIIAGAACFPAAREFVTTNPGTVLALIAGLNTLLRLVTNKRLSLFGDLD